MNGDDVDVTTEAINRVHANADKQWLKAAHSAVIEIASRQQFFSTDDIWNTGLSSPREPRAMGAVMREAVRLGICMATDRTIRSTRPECHKRPIQVWRSRIAHGS